jgi:aminoglycoside 6'-N-acetyltransferase
VPTAGIGFRALTRQDLARLSGWLAQPHVSRWWREPSDLAAVRERYLPCVEGRDPTELFIIEVGGSPAGFIQRYLISDDPDWAAALAATGVAGREASAGIDYLIGDPAMTGRGLGTAAIRAFTGLTFARYPRVDSVIVDVSQANVASWRALEKAGFTRIWAGELASADPSDDGPAYLYRIAAHSREAVPPANNVSG